MASFLPAPSLQKRTVGGICAYTDERLCSQTGVRIAFTARSGGVSTGEYASLNVGEHVEDDYSLVCENRRRIQAAFGFEGTSLIVPKQVHGDKIVLIKTLEDVPSVQEKAAEGADAVIVDTPGVGALLCFADCVPVIIVSPTGRFAVVHAGWRGVENTISAKAVGSMAQADAAFGFTGFSKAFGVASSYNVYIGPHIRSECFETSPEVHKRFVLRFGQSCVWDERHINLAEALRVQLTMVGVDESRIYDMGVCTVCTNEEFFSYRAQNGTAGRHAAFAQRSEGHA